MMSESNGRVVFLLAVLLFGILFVHTSAEELNTGLPLIYLEVDNGSETLLNSPKGYSDTGSIRIVDASGQILLDDTLDQIKLHGNTTINYEKKPFQIKLTNKAPLFGMEADKTWILLANYIDHSLLRNQLALHLAAEVGLPCTPQFQPVEVILDGNYVGSYLLCEKVEIDSGRVPLKQGWLVEIVQTQGNNWDKPDFTLPSGMGITVKDAKLYDRTDTAPLEGILSEIDLLISDPDGWNELCTRINTESLVRKYVLDELLANFDGGIGSQYFIVDIYEEQSQVYCGPVWDYDNTLGINYIKSFPDKFYVNNYVPKDDPPLFVRLWKMKEFRESAMNCYRDEFRPLIDELIDWLKSQALMMQSSARQNFERWPIDYSYHPNVKRTGNTYEENVLFLIDFLSQRIEFLDKEWIEVTD